MYAWEKKKKTDYLDLSLHPEPAGTRHCIKHGEGAQSFCLYVHRLLLLCRKRIIVSSSKYERQWEAIT